MKIDAKQGEILELFPTPLQKVLELLHLEFEPQRQELLQRRRHRQNRYDAGEVPHFERSHPAHSCTWQVGPIPADMQDRRVEITGPVSNTKMVIQMLSENSEGERACTAMLDFEDSMAPTWDNVVSGLKNIVGVAHGTLGFTQASDSGPEKIYRLDPARMAAPMVRVRGLHLNETRMRVNGEPVAAGLFELASTAFHTAALFLKQKRTPKFYVPKCEHFLEARWWNSVFRRLEEHMGLPRATLRVTFLIETLPAAFQMTEILYEIRERACGLNGGRWDKIFSDIKTLRAHPNRILADRASIDMSRPWMDNYARLLIKTCHAHGAFAMGGMAAFTPGPDPETRRAQIEKVLADKKREADIGHDGCWVSHPFFIGPAKRQFTRRNQLDRQLPNFPSEPSLLPEPICPKTLTGLRQNIRVGIAYQQGWDQGLGCISFENLMEDLATLEISRAQTWQWLRHQVRLDDGTPVTRPLIERLFDEELEKILRDKGPMPSSREQTYRTAKNEVQKLFLSRDLPDFFTTA